MAKEKKKGKALIIVLLIVTLLDLVLGMVYLTATGRMQVAIETVMRWGEDGTLTRVGVFIEETLPPIIISAGVGVGAILAALLPVIKKLKDASQQMDHGTKISVKTAELAESAREEMLEHDMEMINRMELFMCEQRNTMESFIQSQSEVLSGFMRDMKADAAGERAKTGRIENGVGKLIRMEKLAHGAEEELVKKGVASEIARITEETPEANPDGEAADEEDDP
ncbi:MAG: hypothetical protein J6D21_07460 [Clostridia bacterium]|nr:hypothetical protein [Clostridia bacterium]